MIFRAESIRCGDRIISKQAQPQNMPTFGAIYIAHNPTDGKDVYKVGLTERSVPERMSELTAGTSNLGKYEAVGYVVVNDVQEAEQRCHNKLSYCRVQDNREFFKETLETIIRIVRECCQPFEVKDCLPATKAEELPDIREIVSKRLEKGAEEKNFVDAYHSTLSENIRENVRQVLPLLAELKNSLPSENLKAVIYDPQLDFARQANRSSPTEVKLVDVMFFGQLVKGPIKISVLKDREDFLQLSRVVQEPEEHPSESWRDRWCVFDDDGRWLQISGSIKCAWANPKDKNDGYFLYGHAFEIKVARISCKEVGHSAVASYERERNEVSAYLSGVKDFVRILAIVCADNAKLCPVIDRYFSSIGRYANLNDSYISQQPLTEAMKPYLVTQTKKGRK